VEVPSDIFQTLANEKQSGKKVLAIGTTSCRSLESLPHLWKKERDQLLSKVDKEALLYWDSLSSDIKDTQVGDIKILSESIQFQTRIYIYPGIPLRIVDELITNFHLPESSLLLLV
jgi:S-adenosylmethionine:tRNA ribosyltransferase-isomerase